MSFYGKILWTFIPLLCFILIFAVSYRQEIDPNQKIKIEDVDTPPQKLEKQTILYFSASWCGPCQHMKKSTLRDSIVLKELQFYNFKIIDIDNDQILKIKYNVTRIPAFIKLNSNGEIIKRTTGYMSISDFLDWLK